LWAVGWLLPDLVPGSAANPLSLPLRQAILFSAFAAIAASFAVARRLQFPRRRLAWASAGVGLGFFVIPTAAAALARGRISNFDAVAILCVTPVFAVVVEPYLQDGPPRRGRAALAGALIAIVGILLLLPLETPSSLRDGLTILALLATAFTIAATNCFAVRLAGVVGSTLPMAALAGSVSAVCFALAAA